MSAIRHDAANVVDNNVSRSHDADAPEALQSSQASPVRSICSETAETSKLGWGGARANSGGARPGSGRKPAQRVIQRNPPGPRWYVLQIQAHARDRIVRDLAEGESRTGYALRPPFVVQLPMTAVERVRRGKREVVQVPMFVGYLFVEFDRETDNWPTIQQVDGVIRVFTTRSLNPIPVPVGFVEMLIAQAPERLNLPAARMEPCEPGQALRLTGGPMNGFPAQCISCDGLTTRVSVHVFGRDVEMAVRRDGVA